jgi:serine/threonine-protein kinase
VILDQLMVMLQLLGSVDLRHPGGREFDALLRQPKRVALLSYLAAATPRGFRRRDTLMGLFWPESTQDQARHALSQTLHVLRRELGDEALLTRGEGEVDLNRHFVSCDVWAFEAALAGSDPEGAVALYRGPFLQGLSVRASAEFDQWVERERDSLACAHAKALEQLAEACAERGAHHEAVAWWRKLAEHDPYGTNVTLRLMEALDLVQDRAGALEQAERHAERLREDLDAEPSPDVAAYAERLRKHPAPRMQARGDLAAQLRRALSGRYTVEQELSSGRMARVFLAEDSKHHREVAVKVLRPELAATVGRERFLREIEVTSQLSHPHILPLLDSGEAGGLLYYVMPYVEGESLADRLAREKQLALEDTLRIAAEVADGLEFAHQHGVLHRDIKPGNIMFEGGHAVVVDFGLALAISAVDAERLTESGFTVGTPEYMSPEQVRAESELDGRSDLYSLACMVYEMLAGEPPFTGPSTESVARQHLVAEPRSVTAMRSTVPESVSQSITKALAKSPGDRFTSAERFAQALVAAAEKSVGRAWLKPALGVIGAVVVVVLGALVWQPWDTGGGAGESAWAWTILAEVEGTAPEDIRQLVGSLLAGDVDASRVLLTLPRGQIRRGLARAMKPDTARLTYEVAKELAERGGIETVVAAQLDRLGGTYALTVRVVRGEGDSVLATQRVTAADDDALIPATREAVERVMPVLSAWMGGVVRPFQADPLTTPSLAAFRRAQAAARANALGRYSESIALWHEVLEIDPDFAMAWRRMGATFRNAGFPDSAQHAFREALKRPERLTEIQRAQVEAAVAGDPVTILQTRERLYRETGIATNTYGAALMNVNRHEDAVPVFEQMAEQSPFGLSELVYTNWARCLIVVGRVEEAEAVASTLEGTPHELPMRVRVAVRKVSLGKEDWRTVEGLALELARDQTRDARWRSEGMRVLASARAAQGRVREAVAARHELTRTNQRAGRQEAYRTAHLNNLILTIAAGLPPEPWDLAGLHADTTAYARVLSGLWAAQLGDTALAKSYLDALPLPEVGEFDPPTYQNKLVATLYARIAMRRSDWEEAVRLLEPVTEETSYQMPHWPLAEAYEALGQVESAIRLYGGITRPEHVYALDYGLTSSFAHRKAALLYGQIGQNAEAIEHWRAFLDAFTEPDPEYEWMVEEARAELDRLEGER